MSKKLVIITVATLTALVSPALAAGSGHHKKMPPLNARAVDPRSDKIGIDIARDPSGMRATTLPEASADIRPIT